MSGIGHNSKELDRVAKEARKGLKQVHEKEEGVIEGWLIYGAALNEGRRMFPSNNQFHEWKVSSQLATTSRDDEAAAMWAAANSKEFESIKESNPRVRTVRGLHAKWKEEEKEREEDKRLKTDDNIDVDNTNDDSSEDLPDFGLGSSDDKDTKDDSEYVVEDDCEKPNDQKPKPVNNPDYSIAEGMGAIKGIAELYSREYGGTPEDAADVLFSQTVKGCEQDSIGMSIARDRVKWFLKLKEVMDLVEPKMHDFLNQESKLQVIK